VGDDLASGPDPLAGLVNEWPSTGSVTATTIKFQSSSSLGLRLFMLVYVPASFTEGHELDRKWRVPEAMIGRRLSQEEAKRLLAKFD
jgi:hypothetical protein